MRQTIQSSFLEVSVNEQGAELCSIRGSDGMEYLWDADPNVWDRHAPILFPIVGKLADDTYTCGDVPYKLGQHGFARDMPFELTAQDETRLAYRLQATPETRACYPFEFALEVTYELRDLTLHVHYAVTNRNGGSMPFSIGAHPGFSLKWGAEDRPEDYYLEFSERETLDTHLLSRDHLLSDETERVLSGETRIQLRSDLFDRDALIFMDAASDEIALRSHKHDREVRVRFPGFPYLGIWAKPGAAFVCIEPWHGHVDPEGTNGRITDKPGIRHLAANTSFSCTHSITIQP